MFDTIVNVINQIDKMVWGWWMILLFLGTHIFMTVRTGFIQRKIGKAIRLSVTKDPDAEGEVSQFGALTTAPTPLTPRRPAAASCPWAAKACS